MNRLLSHPTTTGARMARPNSATRTPRGTERGQIIVVAALAMITIIGGVSLVIEGGNAYAHQRIVQNSIDAVANARATVIAQKIGGAPRTDADVAGSMSTLAASNDLDAQTGYYTNVTGALLTPAG